MCKILNNLSQLSKIYDEFSGIISIVASSNLQDITMTASSLKVLYLLSKDYTMHQMEKETGDTMSLLAFTCQNLSRSGLIAPKNTKGVEYSFFVTEIGNQFIKDVIGKLSLLESYDISESLKDIQTNLKSIDVSQFIEKEEQIDELDELMINGEKNFVVV